MSVSDSLNISSPPARESADIWSTLSGGEIYDRWCVPGSKMGILANRIIKEMKNKALLDEVVYSKLAKTKETRYIQRSYFANLVVIRSFEWGIFFMHIR